MKPEEAIKELSEWLNACCGAEEIEPTREALRMAIEALKAQPDLQPTCNNLATDTIYRQAAIDLVEGLESARLKGKIDLLYPKVVKGLIGLPSAQPERKWIKCESCGCTVNQPKNDSIYRSEEKARENAIEAWNRMAKDE